MLFRYFYLHSGFRSCSWVRYLRYRYFDSSHRYFDIPILQFRYFRYFNSQMSTFPIMPSNKHYTSNNCCLHLMISLFVVWSCTTTLHYILLHYILHHCCVYLAKYNNPLLTLTSSSLNKQTQGAGHGAMGTE